MEVKHHLTMSTYTFAPDVFTLRNAQNWGIDISKKRITSFLSKIDGIDVDNPTFEENKCYVWNAAGSNYSKKGSKHGVFRINKGQGRDSLLASSRVMYILTYGIPTDIVDRMAACPCGKKGRDGTAKSYGSCCRPMVLHKCKDITGKDHDGKCMNPLHLYLGIAAENQHDIRHHGTGKGGIFKGETAYQAKMTNDQARAVWADIQGKTDTLKNIALKHGVSYSTVKDMNRGKAWNDITGKDKSKFNKQRIKRDEEKYQESKKRKRDDEDQQPAKKRKLTADDVKAIYTELKNGGKRTDVAKKFNIPRSRVVDIHLKKTWKLITDQLD